MSVPTPGDLVRPVYRRTSGLPINECNCCRCRPVKGPQQ